jgi:hypothetical protein
MGVETIDMMPSEETTIESEEKIPATAEKVLQGLSAIEIIEAFKKIETSDKQTEIIQNWLKSEKNQEFLNLFASAVKAEDGQDEIQNIIKQLDAIREEEATKIDAEGNNIGDFFRAENSVKTIEMIKVLSERSFTYEILIKAKYKREFINGKETWLSNEIHGPVNYTQAVEWCESHLSKIDKEKLEKVRQKEIKLKNSIGKTSDEDRENELMDELGMVEPAIRYYKDKFRLLTQAECRFLASDPKTKEEFKGMIIWTSDMRDGNHTVFDFGKKEIPPYPEIREDSVAVNVIYARAAFDKFNKTDKI